MFYTGVDFGGTKIEAVTLDDNGTELSRLRVPNPGTYSGAIDAIIELTNAVETKSAERHGAPVRAFGIGLGIPGSVSPRTGEIRNANTTWINGRPFAADLERALGRRVRLSNDANCLALSEALDGAGAGAGSVAALILGTGFGGGLVLNGQLIDGANGIAGEMGHFGLPWAQAGEAPGPQCWCGQRGCVETWVSGTGFARDFADHTARTITAENIIEAMRHNEPEAMAAFQRFLSRLARTLATIANIYDPEVFVLGGGLSNVPEIFDQLPEQIRRYVFSDRWDSRLVPARWGDSSGVRGAAYLWRETQPAAGGETQPIELAMRAVRA